MSWLISIAVSFVGELPNDEGDACEQDQSALLSNDETSGLDQRTSSTSSDLADGQLHQEQSLATPQRSFVTAQGRHLPRKPSRALH